MVKLIGLVGTNSKKSTNRQLLQYIQKHLSTSFRVIESLKRVLMCRKYRGKF